MITIGNQPLGEPSWIATLNSLQMSILQHMQRSSYEYAYDHMQQLQFELRLRESIIGASRDLYNSGVQYAVFEHSRCNLQYWILTPAGGFRLRPGVRPSTAISDIYNNGVMYAFECATAMVILLYKAVLDVIGPQTFDRLFQNLLLWAWQYDQDLGLTTGSRPDLIPADIVYFKNPDVNPATPEWQGENAVWMGGNLYYGHGVGITSAEAIITALNQNRRPGATRSAYMLDQSTRPDYRYLSQFAGPVRTAIGKIGTLIYRWAYPA